MKLLIIIALAITSTGNLFAQDSLHFDLLSLEEQFFVSQNDTLRNNLSLQKFNLSLILNLKKERLLFELNRIHENLITDSIDKLNYIWNASLVTKLNKEFAYSNMYIDATHDSSDQTKILGLLIKSEIDSATYFRFLTNNVSDSSYNCMNCLNDLNEYKLPNKRGYLIASSFFPGLGTILTGDVYNGLGSLILVPGSIYSVFRLWRGGLYFNAISWGIALIPRLYFGNTRLTREKVSLIEKRHLNKLADACEISINKKLIEQPINYKLK